MKTKEAQEVIEKLEREASLLEMVLSVSGRLNKYIFAGNCRNGKCNTHNTSPKRCK